MAFGNCFGNPYYDNIRGCWCERFIWLAFSSVTIYYCAEDTGETGSPRSDHFFKKKGGCVWHNTRRSRVGKSWTGKEEGGGKDSGKRREVF